MQPFCDGADQDFYRRNHLFSLKQTRKRLLLGYFVDASSVKVEKNIFTAVLVNQKAECSDTKLNLTVEFYECGAMKMFIDEPSEKRFRPSIYSITKDTLKPAPDIAFNRTDKICTIAHKIRMEDTTFEGYKTEGECSYVINYSPFDIECYYNDELAITINQRQFLNYDFRKSFDKLLSRARDTAELNLLLSGWEQFSHGHTIDCPKGPQSVAIDVTFHNLPKCYGLPERFRRFQLEQTTMGGKSEPYRLYNLDMFNKNLVNQALYGVVPFVIGTGFERSLAASFMWLNSSDTYVDFEKFGNDSKLHFVSESGVLECMTYLGANALDITMANGIVTGKPIMPQFFTLGYHQCRWEKYTQEDIEFSSLMFKQTEIPCDCLWLDIEYTEDKKYFTWDHQLFPKPLEMIDKLKEDGRHLVVIIDPHLKVDTGYNIYNEAMERGKSRL
jgi:alpha 1,3-glucosidase